MREFNLLVVDDDRIYLDMVKELFEYTGLKVACADSGKEALEMIKGKPIDLIFTDFSMPGMNGIELAGRVLEIAPDARIVMTTSDPAPEIAEIAMRAGISRVTVKPYKLKDILDIIIDEDKKELFASLREAVSGSMMGDKKKEQKKEEKPSEVTGKEEHHGMTPWTCPGCGAPYTGWSTLNRCFKCGYEECEVPFLEHPPARK